jgi:hypothetical protein
LLGGINFSRIEIPETQKEVDKKLSSPNKKYYFILGETKGRYITINIFSQDNQKIGQYTVIGEVFYSKGPGAKASWSLGNQILVVETSINQKII